MILLLTFEHRDHTGKVRTLVSSGTIAYTGQVVKLPAKTPESMGAEYNPKTEEWIIHSIEGGD